MGIVVLLYAVFVEPWVHSDAVVTFTNTLFYIWLLINMVYGLSGLSYNPWIQKYDQHAYALDWEAIMRP